MTASRFKFEPAMLQVSEGDRVRLTLRSMDTEHGLEIKKLKVKVAVPKGGDPVTVEFVADKPGTYEFKCSEYCGSGHGRMKGQIFVTPRAE
jgi:cytochrome c oxidase subunit 2